jgi:hypothetical protein
MSRSAAPSRPLAARRVGTCRNLGATGNGRPPTSASDDVSSKVGSIFSSRSSQSPGANVCRPFSLSIDSRPSGLRECPDGDCRSPFSPLLRLLMVTLKWSWTLTRRRSGRLPQARFAIGLSASRIAARRAATKHAGHFNRPSWMEIGETAPWQALFL